MTEEIANAIIAGIGSADNAAEQALGILDGLKRAGYAIVSTPLQIAAPDMLDALIQVTSRADKDLKEKFRDRTSECARDYAMCMDAIARATGK